MDERIWSILVEGFGKIMIASVKVTIPLTIIGFAFAMIIAMFMALVQYAKIPVLKEISRLYIWIFRGTPLLVQLFIIYYVVFAGIKLPGFKLFGFIKFDRFLPGVVALSMNSGAYLSEIIRAGIQSIDGGQSEAARSLGMSSFQTMQHIILPQAIRNILPPIANEFVTIIKESSVTYTIGVQDIMYAVASVKGSTFSIAEPLIIATCIYFCLTFPTSKIIAHFERKMSKGYKR